MKQFRKSRASEKGVYDRALDKKIATGYFFLFLIETVCCNASSEQQFGRDGSDEGSQHMFLCIINKDYHELSGTLSYLEL